MSKGAKAVIGVVASVLIPFAAPVIAGAIAGSSLVGGFVSAIGGSITAALGGGAFGAAVAGGLGSGLVGAGLGAASAALTGGDIGKGALYGGVGSALTGGLKAFSAAKTAATTGPNGAFPTVGEAAAAGPATGGVGGLGGIVPGGITSVSGTPIVAGAEGAKTILGQIGAGLGEAAPRILKQAATYLVSGVLSATSADEQRQIQLAAQRMRELQGQNDQLYQQLLQEAQSIDPNARGEQWFNDAKIQGIAATEAAVERVNPRNQGAIAEVTRAGFIDALRNATIASRTGYDQAVNERRSAINTAATFPRTNAALGALDLATEEETRRGRRREGIASAITGLFTPDPGENPDPRVRDQALQAGYA